MTEKERILITLSKQTIKNIEQLKHAYERLYGDKISPITLEEYIDNFFEDLEINYSEKYIDIGLHYTEIQEDE